MPKEFTFEERIRQDLSLLTVNDEFFADFEAMSKKYDLPVKEDEVDGDGRPWIMDNEDFHRDGDELIKKYNLPESHIFIFCSFLLNGHLNFILDTELWHLNPGMISANRENCIMLKIYPETTLKDIQNNWARIKKSKDRILNKKINKVVRIKNLERDLEILKLKRQYKKANEIARIINSDKRFSKELIGFADVSRIIKRLKELSEKNMPRKKS